MLRKITLITFIVFFSFEYVYSEAKNPKTIIEAIVDKVGTYEKLKSMEDVEYTYTHRDNSKNREDISIERYVFDGELSWAKYTKHKNVVFPDTEGEVVQGYNGKESWVTINGRLVTDDQANKLADFLRKTNFYWFAMMQKLLDPGLNYSYEGTEKVKDIEYDIIRVTFNEGVGDVSDTYLLYVNPETKLVDQFLFTVMDFGVTEPYLMKVEYVDVNGLKLPAKRRFIKSNWYGEIFEDKWTDEIMTNIKFKNGFSKQMFEKPEQ